jgi:hypothetical protein
MVQSCRAHQQIKHLAGFDLISSWATAPETPHLIARYYLDALKLPLEIRSDESLASLAVDSKTLSYRLSGAVFFFHRTVH